MNRLAQEASPYLQQHAKNPVDWYPWGAEALARAKELDRPILLSVGYSACHWCHVMERESFEDEATAAVMNELFVSIKVDREERPDLDQVYQVAVQLLGRSGGWPLTAFLAPDGRPFFAGTYFPPKERYGMPGFTDVLRAVADAYKTKRAEIDAQADEMTKGVRSVTAIEKRADRGYLLGPELLTHATAKLAARFDDENGGFGARPKFPNTMALSILQRRGVLENDAMSAHRFRRALEAMRNGGIHDQLGGGFHRYSTDAAWQVPHFEKMLYDNALLLRAYTDAWRAFGDGDDQATAEGIVAYLAREMTAKDGAFFATQDADSEGEEGRFFIWTREQMSRVLADDPAAREVAIAAYGVTAEGNFEESGVHGATVLGRRDREARGPALTEADRASLERARVKLFASRETRVKPFRDEKVIAGWNGLMIGALADAAAAFGNPEWLARAETAFATVMARLATTDADGTIRLQRLYKEDVVRGPGFLDDYAYLAAAALDLYEASGNPSYARTARALADAIALRFSGETAADGFFFTPADGESLIHRSKDPYDQAVPNGAATAFDVLLKLGTLCDASYGALAEAALDRIAGAAVENPMGMGTTVLALDRLVRGSVDIVLVGAKSDARSQALAKEAHRAYVPLRNLAWLDPNDASSREAVALLAEGKGEKDEPCVYICRNRTCSLPISDPRELARALASS